MVKAKAFFFVSLGILALAVAFHLGARSAQGQASRLSQGHISTGSGGETVTGLDESGQFWVWQRGSSVRQTGDLPKPGNVVATSGYGGWGAVLYDDGDLYFSSNYPAALQWEFMGNLFDSPVQSTQTTWGRVKAERR